MWFFVYTNDRFSNEMISTTQYPKLEWLTFCHYITLLIEHVCEAVTPKILKQHRELCRELARMGITEKYSWTHVQRWKRHVVSNHSTFKSRMVARMITLSDYLKFELDIYKTNKWYSGFVKFLSYTYIVALENRFGDPHSLKLYNYAYWKSIPAHTYSQKKLPKEVLKVIEGTKVPEATTITIEEAFLGTESLDPFLTYTVLPTTLNNILCVFGVTYFNLTITQWDDDRFHTLGFAKKVAIR